MSDRHPPYLSACRMPLQTPNGGTVWCTKPDGHDGPHTSLNHERRVEPPRPGNTQAVLEWADEIERLTRERDSALEQRRIALDAAKAERVAADKSIGALVDLLWRCHAEIVELNVVSVSPLADEIVTTLNGYGNGGRYPMTPTAERMAALETELAQVKGALLGAEAERDHALHRLAEAENDDSMGRYGYAAALADVIGMLELAKTFAEGENPLPIALTCAFGENL